MKKKMVKSTKVELSDLLKIQFNTRISYRMRSAMDTYIAFIGRPLVERPPGTEDWPDSIVTIVDDALTTFFADHPTQLRKGPRKTALTKKES